MYASSRLSIDVITKATHKKQTRPSYFPVNFVAYFYENDTNVIKIDRG
jgi:hypothetical protein